MRSMVLLIAVMHEQAVQHTSLYKRHVSVRILSKQSMEEWARWIMSPVLKTGVGREFYRGFESHLFLQEHIWLLTKDNYQLLYEYGREAELMRQCATLEIGGSSPSPSSKFIWARKAGGSSSETVNLVLRGVGRNHTCPPKAGKMCSTSKGRARHTHGGQKKNLKLGASVLKRDFGAIV